MSLDKTDRILGPSLQPDEVVPSSGIGPAIPVEFFKAKLAEKSSIVNPADSRVLEDLSTIGPLIPGQELREEYRHFRDEEELSAVDRGASNSLKRDAWMTELLPVTQGPTVLKPRKFNQSIQPKHVGDSSWFKAPQDRNRPIPGTSETEMMNTDASQERALVADVEYNTKMHSIRSSHQKSSDEPKSLMDMHTKEKDKKHKRKDKKKDKKSEKKEKKSKHHKSSKKHKKHRNRSDSPEVQVRVPFDRDKDLKINQMDSQARNSLIERSKQLSTRFSHGSRQYL